MKPFSIAISIFALAATLAAAPASAQQSNAGLPDLHVGGGYSNCFFDLHPELTQAEFDEFAGELGSILRFRQLADPATLGRGRVDVSLQYASTPIDDGKGAWNNTMSHPAADHYLGDSIAFPRIVARFGVSDHVDVGAWGGINPRSNYGMLGVDTKVALLTQGATWPVSVSIRPSVTSLLGPSELWAANASVDVSVSRSFGRISPYGGVAASASLAVERSDDVNLDPATVQDGLVYAGVSYRWRALIVSAEAEKASLVSYAFRVGTRFRVRDLSPSRRDRQQPYADRRRAIGVGNADVPCLSLSRPAAGDFHGRGQLRGTVARDADHARRLSAGAVHERDARTGGEGCPGDDERLRAGALAHHVRTDAGHAQRSRRWRRRWRRYGDRHRCDVAVGRPVVGRVGEGVDAGCVRRRIGDARRIGIWRAGHTRLAADCAKCPGGRCLHHREGELAGLDVDGIQRDRDRRADDRARGHVPRNRRTIEWLHGHDNAVGAGIAAIVGDDQRQGVRADGEPCALHRAKADHRAAFPPFVIHDRAVGVGGGGAVEANQFDAVRVVVGHRLIGTRIGDRMCVGEAEGERVVHVEAVVNRPRVEPYAADAGRVGAAEQQAHDLLVRRHIAARPRQRRGAGDMRRRHRRAAQPRVTTGVARRR